MEDSFLPWSCVGREETEIEADGAIFRISPPGLYSVGANHHRREKAWWKEEDV